MTSRAIFIECGTPCWVDIAANLSRTNDWTPVYWIAPPYLREELMARFPGLIVHSRLDSYHMISPPELAAVEIEPLDQEILQQMSDAQVIAMKMMDVMDSVDAFNFNERMTFFRDRLRYWRSIIRAVRPDVAVFPFSPHCVYDYIIFRVCRAEGVRTLLFEATFNLSMFYPIEDFREGSKEIAATYRQLCAADVPDSDIPLSEFWQGYVTRARGSYAAAVPPYMRMQLENFPASMAGDVYLADARRQAGLDFIPGEAPASIDPAPGQLSHPKESRASRGLPRLTALLRRKSRGPA